MLGGVSRSAVPVCLAAITINVLVRSPACLVRAALPPGAEDEIVLIEHLPGRRVHLRDFFWTSAEDAPPWLDPDQTSSLHETRTIPGAATVRAPGCASRANRTPSLVESDRGIGVLLGEDPGPRYWLLTVLRSGESVPSEVELRLARLYRAAFSRQQQRHLGLLANDPRLRRAAAERRAPGENRRPVLERSDATDARAEAKNESPTGSPDGPLKSRRSVEAERTRRRVEPSRAGLPEVPSGPSADTDSSPVESSTGEPLGPGGRPYEATDSPVAAYGASASSGNSTDERAKIPRDGKERSGRAGSLDTGKLVSSSSDRPDSSRSGESKSRPVEVGLVQVRMRNTSLTETGSARLIYSVHLGGKPVPAETAARDMALLSPQEVALELGVPVVVQSEPYLKETRPLALSRKRDAWLLVGAAGAAIVLLTLVVAALIIAAKRKRARGAVSARPVESVLEKDRGYAPTTPAGTDNTGYTSETEARTDRTGRRRTPGSRSRSPPMTPLAPESLAEDDARESSSDDEDESRRERSSKARDTEDRPIYLEKSRGGTRGRAATRTEAAIDRPRTPADSTESPSNEEDNLESPEEALRPRKLEETASPRSYLSMPSCKSFPSARSVEPLSRILEPVVARRLDPDLDAPETERRANGASHRDRRASRDERFARARSVREDPGVVGPIVWDLGRRRTVQESGTSETEVGERASASGPVGRAGRRLHELLEDSFGLFAAKDAKSREPACFSSRPSSAARPREPPTARSESRGESARASPVGTPVTRRKPRPYASLPRGENQEIPETGNATPHPRGAWGSRPLSAGPFHRPNLPEIDVNRVLADHRLPPEDPAVPLVAAVKKELDKFVEETRS